MTTPTLPPGYRMLEPQEIPKPGDELSNDDGVTWAVTNGNLKLPAGHYTRTIFRRKIEPVPELACSWVLCSERLPTDNRVYWVQFVDGLMGTVPGINLRVRVCDKYHRWLDAPEPPAVVSESDQAFDEEYASVNPQSEHCITYRDLAKHFWEAALAWKGEK